MATAKMKVGMLFKTDAPIDLTIKDLDDSPRYIKLWEDSTGKGVYFRDYSKEYENDCWNVDTIKHDFDLDWKTFVRKNPDYIIHEAYIHLILFNEDDKAIQFVRLDYNSYK